jgi:hypothetical protein
LLLTYKLDLLSAGHRILPRPNLDTLQNGLYRVKQTGLFRAATED